MHNMMLTAAFTAIIVSGAIGSRAETGALPAHAAPAGLQSIEGASGGRLLVGDLPNQASTDAAFRAGLKSVRSGYFDSAPSLVGVVRTADGRVTIAPFTA